MKKELLNYKKYLEKNEIVIEQNFMYALVVDKTRLEPGTDFSNIKQDKDFTDNARLGNNQAAFKNATILMHDGRRFDINFADAHDHFLDNSDVAGEFESLGYATVGDCCKMYFTADGNVYGYNEGPDINHNYRWQTIDKEEIGRGQLLGEFLKAIVDNDDNNNLEDYLKNFEMTQENLELMNNDQFKLIAKNAVKFAWEEHTINTYDEMAKQKKSKPKIIEMIQNNKNMAQEEVDMLDNFFKEAKKEITTEEGISELDEALDEISSL